MSIGRRACSTEPREGRKGVNTFNDHEDDDSQEDLRGSFESYISWNITETIVCGGNMRRYPWSMFKGILLCLFYIKFLVVKVKALPNYNTLSQTVDGESTNTSTNVPIIKYEHNFEVCSV